MWMRVHGRAKGGDLALLAAGTSDTAEQGSLAAMARWERDANEAFGVRNGTPELRRAQLLYLARPSVLGIGRPWRHQHGGDRERWRGG